MGIERGFDEKIDVIDLIISVLREHEEKLDELNCDYLTQIEMIDEKHKQEQIDLLNGLRDNFLKRINYPFVEHYSDEVKELMAEINNLKQEIENV